jgi:hypothetical protein
MCEASCRLSKGRVMEADVRPSHITAVSSEIHDSNLRLKK